jgi:hypothetical protein
MTLRPAALVATQDPGQEEMIYYCANDVLPGTTQALLRRRVPLLLMPDARSCPVMPGSPTASRARLLALSKQDGGIEKQRRQSDTSRWQPAQKRVQHASPSGQLPAHLEQQSRFEGITSISYDFLGR